MYLVMHICKTRSGSVHVEPIAGFTMIGTALSFVKDRPDGKEYCVVDIPVDPIDEPESAKYVDVR